MPNPAEWRDTLVHRLDARWSKWRVYDAYYEGDQRLAYMTRRFREQYGSLFASLADNWMKLVVDAAVERLRVQGIRFGPDQDADKDAWAIWQDNGLDAQSNMLHTEAVKLGEAYWLVQPNGDKPRITAEHPSQVIVATAPGDKRVRLAALKKWQGDDGFVYANVYLPDRVVKYRTKRDPSLFEGIVKPSDKWVTIGAGSNPLREVPVIPVSNNPSMIHGGRSDLAFGAISLQDAINKELTDMLVGSEYIAYPQRVLMGIDQPRDPATGKPVPIDQWQDQAQSSRLWMFPGKDGKAFEFSAAQLKNFGDAIDVLVDHLTAQTRTPPHYMSGKIENVSGDTLKAAETGLVCRVRDKHDSFGDGHEDTLRLAFKSIDPDDPRAQAMSAETIWRDPESRSQAELADALTKLATIGVPQEILWERYGFSPTEIDRMKSMQETDALLSAASQPPVTNGMPTPEMREAMSAGQPAVPPRN
jgi:hypothetical protein